MDVAPDVYKALSGLQHETPYRVQEGKEVLTERH